jgi:hypothetical protein
MTDGKTSFLMEAKSLVSLVAAWISKAINPSAHWSHKWPWISMLVSREEARSSFSLLPLLLSIEVTETWMTQGLQNSPPGMLKAPNLA